MSDLNSPFKTKQEAADRLRCSKRQIERLIAAGELCAASKKGQRVLIAFEELLCFEEHQKEIGRARSLNARAELHRRQQPRAKR